MRTYTFNECYELLHVDPKTFRGWLKEAGIDPGQQVSRADRRIRFLTQAQLERLAEDHGRLLRGSSLASDEAISPGAFKLLMDRMQRAEEEIASQQQRREEAQRYVEEVVAQLRAEFQEHRATLNERITAFVLSSTEEFKHLQEQLEGVVHQVDKVRETQAERLHQIEAMSQANRDGIKLLQEQLETRIENLAASLRPLVSELRSSFDGLQARQDDLFERLERSDRDQGRDTASPTALVTQEPEQMGLKLGQVQVHRLIQEEQSTSEAGTSESPQKSSRAGRRKLRQSQSQKESREGTNRQV